MAITSEKGQNNAARTSLNTNQAWAFSSLLPTKILRNPKAVVLLTMNQEEGQGREEDVARGVKRKAEEQAKKVSDEVKDRRQEDEESEEREEDEEREEEQEDEENEEEEEEEDDDGYDSAENCWRCRDDMCVKHALRGFGGIVREVVRTPTLTTFLLAYKHKG